MSDEGIAELLEGLASSQPDRAWRQFLQTYTGTLQQVVRRCEPDAQTASECFEHVCQCLSDDRFRRLRAYRPEGPARFRTWLKTVTANLCLDWQRQRRGRFRPLAAIAHLPELEQLVYRCIFVRGMTRRSCLQHLQPRYPALTESTVADINARLFTTLSAEQRWRLGVRVASTGPDGEILALDEVDEHRIVDDAPPDPEQAARDAQDRQRLATALAQLPAPQRLLLRLRFEQELTLAEVARLTGLKDPFQARRHIEAALAALTAAFDTQGSSHDRKSR